MHFDHKHRWSLQTVAPFRVIITPQPFITDLLQKAISTHSSASLLQDRSLGASEAGEQPPGKCPKGEARSTYTIPATKSCGCSNLLLGDDKQRDVSSLVPTVLGRTRQPAALLMAKPVSTDLTHGETLTARSLGYYTCYLDLEISTANLGTPLCKHIYNILKGFFHWCDVPIIFSLIRYFIIIYIRKLCCILS